MAHCVLRKILTVRSRKQSRSGYRARPILAGQRKLTIDCLFFSRSEKNNVLKALRIWVKRKRGRDKQYIDVQTLNYYDLLPESLNEYGKFENLDHLLARANEMISNREVQGNLITVESLICESSGAAWKVEPDVTLSSVSAKKMIVLRLFYQENLISPDTSIGIIDFIPRHLSGGGLFKRPKYEAFDDVISEYLLQFIWN